MNNTGGEAPQPAPAELLGLPGFAVPPGGARPDGSLEGMLQDAPPMGFQHSSFLHQLPNQQQVQVGFPPHQQQQLQQLQMQQQQAQQMAAAAAAPPAGAQPESSGAGAAAAAGAAGTAPPPGANNDALSWYQRNGVTPIALTQEQIDFRRMQQQHHFLYQQQQQQQRYQLELQRQYALSTAVTNPGAVLLPQQQQQQQQPWLPPPSGTGTPVFGSGGVSGMKVLHGDQANSSSSSTNKRSADGSEPGGVQGGSSSSIVSDMGSFAGFDVALNDQQQQQQQFGERKRQRTGPLGGDAPPGMAPTSSAAAAAAAAAAVPSLMSPQPLPGLGFDSSALQSAVNANAAGGTDVEAAMAAAAAAAAAGGAHDIGPHIILVPSLPPVKPPVKCASIANDNPVDGRRARSRSWDIDTNLWTLVERGTRVSTVVYTI
jgi:hypothetical protein